MENAITQSSKGGMIEQVLIKGDLSSLTPEQRSEYYLKVCESVGLNPLTKPFEYIILNNKLTLYALRACTDQLRGIHEVSVEEITETERDGVFIVTTKVKNSKGRTDISKGAVSIVNLKGELLANALMKAETKAKRRATLSICGLGMLDETEIDSISGAQPMKDIAHLVNKDAGEIMENKSTAEFRPSDPLRPYKDKYVIPAPVKPDGMLDFDHFAADLESKIDSADNGNTLSLLNRANSKTLRAMEKERPDLFQSIGDSFRSMSQALI